MNKDLLREEIRQLIATCIFVDKANVGMIRRHLEAITIQLETLFMKYSDPPPALKCACVCHRPLIGCSGCYSTHKSKQFVVNYCTGKVCKHKVGEHD